MSLHLLTENFFLFHVHITQYCTFGLTREESPSLDGLWIEPWSIQSSSLNYRVLGVLGKTIVFGKDLQQVHSYPLMQRVGIVCVYSDCCISNAWRNTLVGILLFPGKFNVQRQSGYVKPAESPDWNSHFALSLMCQVKSLILYTQYSCICSLNL